MGLDSYTGAPRQRRAPGLQLPDDPVREDAHPAAVLTSPGHQAVGKAADVVASLQKGLAEVHDLCEVVVHRTDSLLRIDVGHALIIASIDLPEMPALDRETQQVADRKSQHRAARPLAHTLPSSFGVVQK